MGKWKGKGAAIEEAERNSQNEGVLSLWRNRPHFCLLVVVAKGSQSSSSEKKAPKSFYHRDL